MPRTRVTELAPLFVNDNKCKDFALKKDCIVKYNWLIWKIPTPDSIFTPGFPVASWLNARWKYGAVSAGQDIYNNISAYKNITRKYRLPSTYDQLLSNRSKLWWILQNGLTTWIQSLIEPFPAVMRPHFRHSTTSPYSNDHDLQFCLKPAVTSDFWHSKEDIKSDQSCWWPAL